MLRRTLLQAGAALPVAALARAQPIGATPFDSSTVRNLARQMAGQAYKAPDTRLPDTLNKADYQAYKAIRFRQESALWAGSNSRFTAQFFHRGFLYKDKVDVYEVADGKATQVRYSPDMFTFGDQPAPGLPADLGFAGFRLHYPLNRADYRDEVCAFLGASYFRAVARGQGYGLSARGLAINTAEAPGEEFPLFRSFWLERPDPKADLIVVHALLDSPSAAAAYRFTIRPGEATVFDAEVALYPRADIGKAGLAPMTSMFQFDPSDRVKVDDWRQAVHDSNGLEIRTGHDERIFRPLANPRELQVSTFIDSGPHGFGLVQRMRAFADYQDLESRFEKRPSLWVEPLGDWGTGGVELVEIPSDKEINDNIVGFWRPKDPLKAKGEYLLTYRLHWGSAPPGDLRVARVLQTRTGASWDPKHRQFVIDFVGDAVKHWTAEKGPKLDVGCDKGAIVNAVAEPNPDISGWRISIELDPKDAKIVEVHARLMDGDTPLTETWIYRWTPS